MKIYVMLYQKVRTMSGDFGGSIPKKFDLCQECLITKKNPAIKAGCQKGVCVIVLNNFYLTRQK